MFDAKGREQQKPVAYTQNRQQARNTNVQMLAETAYFQALSLDGTTLDGQNLACMQA